MSNISSVIKNIQDTMRQDAGLDGDAQRISQLVWMLFLKIFDDKEQESALLHDGYQYVLPKRLRWSTWAAVSSGCRSAMMMAFRACRTLAFSRTSSRE